MWGLLCFVFVAAATAAAPPVFGFGNEWVFQDPRDVQLGGLIARAGSRLQRFPGGTPSGFWDWQLGFETTLHDKELQWCPTLPSDLQTYLLATKQSTVMLPNVVTSNLTYELEGLRAFRGAGVVVDRIELGNEIYDMTVPEIKARYPNVSTYAAAIAPWAEALRSEFPGAKLALCGGFRPEWNEALLAEYTGPYDAVTCHVYTSLPPGPYTRSEEYSAVVNQAFVAFANIANLTATTIPSGVEVWFTEMGVYNSVQAQFTWLKALTMLRKLMLFAGRIPGTTVMLPYCAVCRDPNAPAFSTPSGIYPFPNASACPFPGSYYQTATGLVESSLFLAAAGADDMAVLNLTLSVSGLDVLEGVGVGGPTLPGSGASVASPAACKALCVEHAACDKWQWVATTTRCYVKGPGAAFGDDGSSVSGFKNAAPAASKVQGLAFMTGASQPAVLLINTSPVNVTVTAGLPPAAGPYSTSLVSPRTLADVVRQNVTSADLDVDSSNTTSLPSQVLLPPYSVFTALPQ